MLEQSLTRAETFYAPKIIIINIMHNKLTLICIIDLKKYKQYFILLIDASIFCISLLQKLK